MANLTLYRDFYCINHTSFNSDNYVLINPVELSANTYVKNSTAITETLVVYNESLGKYYVKLNPFFYSFDYIYELKWSVVYDLNSPVKILTTRFKMKPYNINSSFDVEVADGTFDVEILDGALDVEG